MQKFESAILAVAREVLASPRWKAPNIPGGDYITELSEHIDSGEQYAGFRNNVEGQFYLPLIESLEATITAEWLPDECCGLPLDQARTFLQRLLVEIERHGLKTALPGLCAHHARLKAALS